MKTTLSFLFLFGFALGSFAQSAGAAKVPEAAKADLAKRFATSTSFKWYQAGNQFEAEYVENGKEIAVAYSSTGQWMETEREIDNGALSTDFIAGFQKSFPGGEIVGVETVERPDLALAYEVKFYVGKKFQERMFDVAGNMEEGQGGSGNGSEGSGEDDED
jgi:hypothetical protein